LKLRIIVGNPIKDGVQLITDTGLAIAAWIDEKNEIALSQTQTAVGGLQSSIPEWFERIPMLHALASSIEFFFVKCTWAGIMLVILTIPYYIPSTSDIEIRFEITWWGEAIALLGLVFVVRWIWKLLDSVCRLHTVEHMVVNAYNTRRPATAESLLEAGSFSVHCGSLIVINAVAITALAGHILPQVYTPPLICIPAFALGIELRALEMRFRALRSLVALAQRAVCWTPRADELRVGVALLQELYRIEMEQDQEVDV